jgi:hypothetical protein
LLWYKSGKRSQLREEKRETIRVKKGVKQSQRRENEEKD